MYQKIKKIFITEPRKRHADTMSLLKDIRWELQAARKNNEAIRLAVALPIINEVENFYTNNQLSMTETLEKIYKDKLSFARFGDGEIQAMLQLDYSLRFQPNTPMLQEALARVLESDSSSRCLIGMPHLYKNSSQTPAWLLTWPRLKGMLNSDQKYGNSHVSRPLFFQTHGQDGVELWRRIWNKKRVTVVTGKGSRFEMIDELFDNVKRSQFIYTKPVNAFTDLNNLIEQAKKQSQNTDIFLIALGPTGTILTQALSHQGMRSIDIGHISDSYLNVFKGGEWPEGKKIKKN